MRRFVKDAICAFIWVDAVLVVLVATCLIGFEIGYGIGLVIWG